MLPSVQLMTGGADMAKLYPQTRQCSTRILTTLPFTQSCSCQAEERPRQCEACSGCPCFTEEHLLKA